MRGTIRVVGAGGIRRSVIAVVSICVMLAPLVSAPTALAFPSPTVALNLTESKTSLVSNTNLIYTATLSDPEVPYRSCDYTDSRPPRIVCTWDTMPSAISGITLTDSLPSGVSSVSVSATGGFACGQNGTVITCSGGLPAYGSATITISVTAPTTLSGNLSISDSTSVNIGNENAWVQATVVPPPLPDLVVTSFTGPQTAVRGGTATFSLNVANIGQASAGNAPTVGVAAQVQGSAGTGDLQVSQQTPSTGSPGFGTPLVPYSYLGCATLSEPLNSMLLTCPGVGNGPTLAPGGTLNATFTLNIPSNSSVGTFGFTACVNPFHTVTESNFSNDCAPTVWLTIS